MSWFDKYKTPEIKLTPGECECGHSRCFHDRGVGECNVAITTDINDKPIPNDQWGECACKVFILDDDDDGGDDTSDVPVDPEVEELEKIAKL